MNDKEFKAEVEELLNLRSVFKKIVGISKTDGGRLTEEGEKLIKIMLKIGLLKADIAKLLDVSPSALTRF